MCKFKNVLKMPKFGNFVMILVSLRMHTKCFLSLKNIQKSVCEKMFVLKFDYERAINSCLPTQKSFVLFLLLQIVISYHQLVGSHIIGCEGHAWVIVQSQKATLQDTLEIFCKGLRSFNERNIEGSSRDYDLVIERFF